MKILLSFMFSLLLINLNAQIINYPWPNTSELNSDKYEIRIREVINGEVGNWINPKVFLSFPRDYSIYKHGFSAGEFNGEEHERCGGTAASGFLQDRTLSFIMFAFSGGIEVEVTKLFGTVASRVDISPKAFGVNPHFFDGKTVRFYMEKPEYVSVDFVSNDNRDDDRFGGKDIKNGVMILGDKPENQAGYTIPKPTDNGVVVYSNVTDLETLRAASIIYFPSGDHNLKDHKDNNSSWYYTVNEYDNSELYHGKLNLSKDGQKVYLAPGAYVRGAFHSNGKKNNWIYGRGIVSGRSHVMHEIIRPIAGANGIKYNQNTQSKEAFCHFGDGAVYNGIMFKEAFHHTCPSGKNTKIFDTKVIGWCSNNDGIRPGSGSVIDHMFIKTSDDYDYARDPHTVSNCIFWPGVNGAIGQLGWNNLGSGYAEYYNNYVINSEWSDSKKDNVGIINGSKSDAGIKLQGNIVEDMCIEGTLNYLVNAAIETGSGSGFLKDFSFKNITVENMFQSAGGEITKQKMRGLSNTILENWKFTNLIVAGELVTRNNYQEYFDLNLDGSNNDVAKKVYNVTFNQQGQLYSISVSSNVGGEISPHGKNGVITTIAGKSQTVSITPITGKKIINVKVDGIDKGRIQNVLFDNISSNHSIEVVFGDGVDFYDLKQTTNPNSTYINTFDYPTASNQAFLSDKYDVFVQVGNGPEQKLEVLMSDVNYRTMYDGDWMKNENKNRTFSFVHLDYDTTGPDLNFRVVKKFGNSSTSVVLSPKSYGYIPLVTKANEMTFTMGDNAKYLSVNFEDDDNETTSQSWIKHMLTIFVDPPEESKPSRDGNGVVLYNENANATALSHASIIYFPSGYHNLRKYTQGGLINNDGVITLNSNQSIYLEGGAFVEGIIQRSNYNDENQRVYGRGILTGRQYYWKNHPNHSGPTYGQLIQLGKNSEVNGVMYMESPNHGLVAPNSHVENVKFLGWHSNHDGIRVGSGSEIEHCFLRAVDDHFYNFDIHVHDCVIWAGHNGAILTYGWGGEQGSNNYGSGSSLIENIDIINPEWTGLGNNNGLIMSQQGYNHPIHDYGSGNSTTIMRNIRVEGSIPGITNLKPRSSGAGNIAVQVASSEVSFLGDLVLENISVEAVFDKGIIRGESDPDYDGNRKWLIKDVLLKNVSIGGECVNDLNKDQFFKIDYETIQNVVFDCVDDKLIPGEIIDLSAVSLSCKEVELTWSDTEGEEGYRVRRRLVGEATYTNLVDVTANLEFYIDNTVDEGLTYEYMVRPVVNGVAVNISNTPEISIRPCLVTSLNEALENELIVYPNPTTGLVSWEGVHAFKLIDISGRVLFEGKSDVLDMTGYNCGLYLLLVNNRRKVIQKY